MYIIYIYIYIFINIYIHVYIYILYVGRLQYITNLALANSWDSPVHQEKNRPEKTAMGFLRFSGTFFWVKTRKNQLNKPLSGWWLTYPPEKYMKVSWDDDIPNILKNKSHVPNHQPDYC